MQRWHRGVLKVFVFTLLMIAVPSVVGANSGPPSRMGTLGGVLPGKSDQVAVKREVLEFDVAAGARQAAVTARYEMENRGAALNQFPVIFVIQANGQGAVESTAVTWNGAPVAVSRVITAELSAREKVVMDQAWTVMDTVVDPVTGQRYSSAEFFGHGNMQYALFYLDLPAQGSGVLEVRYTHISTFHNNVHAHPLYHFQYLLLPAKGWASFGPLEILVKGAGRNDYFFGSNLKFDYADGVWRANLGGLPEENLVFSLMSRKGLIGNIADAGPYYFGQFILYGLLVVAVSLGLGKLFGRIRSRTGAVISAVVTAGTLLGLVGMSLALGILALFPALHDTGYGSAFIAMGEWILSIPAAMIIAGVHAAGRNRRLPA